MVFRGARRQLPPDGILRSSAFRNAPIWGRAVAPMAEWVARAFWSTIRKPDAPIRNKADPEQQAGGKRCAATSINHLSATER